MRHINDNERRNRLAVRHGIHPDHRLPDAVAATRAMTVLHATEAATVHLSVQARVDGTTPADIDHALYEDRSLVKQLAMRRTLFVFPRDLLPAALGSASARVAVEQRRVITRDVEMHGVAEDGAAWLDRACDAVLTRLEPGDCLSAKQLREEIPELRGTITVNTSKKYGGTFQIAPRVFTLLGAQGQLVRATNGGHWRLGRPTWTSMGTWLGQEVMPLTTEEGYAELTRRWLGTFGPGTVEDLQWWLGSTKSAARAALATVDAREVSLDGGIHGWVLPDDEAPVAAPEPWAALLPTLDPTTMGWKLRDFYLAPEHVPYLFDSNGNGGTTAWWNGRIVGCWVQDPDAVVRVVLRDGEEVGAAGTRALQDEAERLTRWLDGVVISNVYKSQLMKRAILP
ncbi:winged helix DNA-binding domain-containing protein [Ornithinicoccus hortensis]|uniref:Winged helix DNA-binding protein n=1 Tax=Ornithinicoccus hortensis TaxID=82346 RepID=A0A542YTR8_9MICO|nr:winged helix DNA-binding domain-containing protein [Ornithinicoccus hortensis]TQL51486.1 winged helix DNA-binding protein [Ornithinicoccus hortensis]